jgi:putative ABC transport system ATP-binding protein
LPPIEIIEGEIFLSYIEFDQVEKEYASNGVAIRALDGACFSINKGELAVILGASGAGKTTALNILGGMDTVTSGDVIVDGENISDYSHRDLIGYRRTDIGFVFQFYNLVPNLTALENVELAAQICPNSLSASETLERVGLADRKNNFPAQLSGGEQQRVSIARAIAKNPKLLLCDEPTGALDYHTGKQILQLLQDTCRNDNITVLIITHNSALVPMADRVIHFRSGRVVKTVENEQPVPIAQIEW